MPTPKNKTITEIESQITHWRGVADHALSIIEHLTQAKDALVNVAKLTSSGSVTMSTKINLPPWAQDYVTSEKKTTYDLIQDSLIEAGRPLLAKEILEYINKSVPDKTDTQLSPQLSTAVQDKKIIKKYKFSNNFYYGLPQWFVNDELKEEYVYKIKSTILSSALRLPR
jgi:hypothetical protein